jgi:hypothetical protein
MTLTVIQDAIIPVFAAYRVHDEYGNRTTLISIHRTKEDAGVATYREGWYGGPGKVITKHAIEDGENLYILESLQPFQFKDVTEQRAELARIKVNQILSKLTEAEIQVLKDNLK